MTKSIFLLDNANNNTDYNVETKRESLREFSIIETKGSNFHRIVDCKFSEQVPGVSSTQLTPTFSSTRSTCGVRPPLFVSYSDFDPHFLLPSAASASE